ncbi:M16 family metallopeptidase [Fluviibacterium sp. S390]|uniref:M16 family metallopeptidase n=1 Tax=Fluviibacterium sp. S390 TaxID=3415139 RepID=UPI003C7C9332
MKRFVAAVALWVGAALPLHASVEITEVTTPAGFTVWLVEEPAIPAVSLEILFKGGTSLDQPGKRGATYLMTAILEEGAGDLDALGFAQARDDLAASFGFDASDDYVSVSARFLSDTTDEAMALLSDALAAPRFDDDAVERVRAQVLVGLRGDAEDPDTVASTAFSEMTFGDHPYGTPGEGTIDTVAALTRDDLLAAHKGALAQDRVYIGAAGDISPERLAQVVDDLMARLPESGAALPPPVTPNFPGGVQVVPFDTPQSVITFAQPGLDRDHPDYFAAYIANQILGGSGFEARLMTEVREKRGLTYGIYSYLLGKDQADLLIGRASTANARAAETIEVVRAEWERMATEGPTEAEVAKAKTFLIGGYPLRFDGNAAIAGIMVGMQAGGLPIDYIATRNDRMAAVTVEDVRRVAGELLDPQVLTFLVVGQPEGLEAGN